MLAQIYSIPHPTRLTTPPPTRCWDFIRETSRGVTRGMRRTAVTSRFVAEWRLVRIHPAASKSGALSGCVYRVLTYPQVGAQGAAGEELLFIQFRPARLDANTQRSPTSGAEVTVSQNRWWIYRSRRENKYVYRFGGGRDRKERHRRGVTGGT